MHVIRWHGDKVQAVLEPSVGYNGPHDAVYVYMSLLAL